MSKKNISYDEAKQKVEDILTALHDPQLKIEEMDLKVDEAVKLIKYCENALTRKRTDIEEALGEE